MEDKMATSVGHAPVGGAGLYPRGSEWRRWDLHVHTPDTAREDQYQDWNSFVAALSNQTEVAVVGVTDYLSIANYTRLLGIKQSQGLGQIELLIPNIEFRIAPPTKKGSAINLHLLVDPSEKDHIERINSALSRLSIEYNKQPHSCTPSEISALGQAYDTSLVGEKQKLSEGVNQFKIDFSEFQDWLRKEHWLSNNSLVAISAGEDGPSGLKEDGWAAKREELWRFAHIVFTGNPQNREFWLAENASNSDSARKMGAPKPCIHGSDAHSLATLFKPGQTRYCWIKANTTFEGLRQTLYEPDERVYIGQQPPTFHDMTRVIAKVEVSGGQVPAFQKDPIPLNSGLVAIIGPKGSGKSALADLIAFAANSFPEKDKTTFLYRAGEYIDWTKIALTWADSKQTTATIGGDQKAEKLVRYLSQSFVERLCSEDYAGTDLAKEIEGVIFGHLNPTDTLNASSFAQLRELRTRDTSGERIALAAKIKSQIAEDEQLRQLMKTIPLKKIRIEELGKEKDALEKQLPQAQNEAEAQAQKDVTALRQQLLKLQTAVGNDKQTLMKIEQLENRLERYKADFAVFRKEFLMDLCAAGIPTGSVDLELRVSGASALADRKSHLQTLIDVNEGAGSNSSGGVPTIKSVNEAIAKAETAVAADQARKAQIQQIQRRIAGIHQEIQRLQNEVTEFESQTVTKLKALREGRLTAYESLFKSWQREQKILAALYKPVQEKLLGGDKEEQQLDFYIKWDVDLEGWLERGNALFDQRKENPFGSPLQLREKVQKLLLPAWSTGDPSKARQGMDSFLQEIKDRKVEQYLKGSVSHSMLLEWVFDHSQIGLNYGLRYHGTELDKLSPGTKGIVLLILYLAMDVDDSRPLIVDQPEENLDSESVYSLLARYFRRAKQRRQVVVITHNPNLVVNTDAEQVIIAAADRQQGEFPSFSYASGSLEDPAIRKRVCSILEGGEKAFLQRERRYALHHVS
jgi:ABC-type lipoprotein export system ATPase subunit